MANKTTKNFPTIFDPLRRKHVALTPEESVRQGFVAFLTTQRNYPATLIANEVTLSIGEKTLRADTIVYDRQMRPLMLVEYKAPSVTITEKVLLQASAYNTLLHVPYIVVTNGPSLYCLHIDYDSGKREFLSDLPTYSALQKSV